MKIQNVQNFQSTEGYILRLSGVETATLHVNNYLIQSEPLDFVYCSSPSQCQRELQTCHFRPSLTPGKKCTLMLTLGYSMSESCMIWA